MSRNPIVERALSSGFHSGGTIGDVGGGKGDIVTATGGGVGGRGSGTLSEAERTGGGAAGRHEWLMEHDPVYREEQIEKEEKRQELAVQQEQRKMARRKIGAISRVETSPTGEVTYYSIKGQKYTFPSKVETEFTGATKFGGKPSLEQPFIPQQTKVTSAVRETPAQRSLILGFISGQLGDSKFQQLARKRYFEAREMLPAPQYAEAQLGSGAFRIRGELPSMPYQMPQVMPKRTFTELYEMPYGELKPLTGQQIYALEKDRQLQKYSEHVMRLSTRRKAFYESEGMKRIAATAKFITFGKPMEERGIVGRTAEEYVGAIMKRSIAFGGYIPESFEKAYLIGKGFGMKETRPAILSELRAGAVRVGEIYKKPSTYLLAGTGAFFMTAPKFIAAQQKPSIVTTQEQIATTQLDEGYETLVISKSIVEIGKKQYDIYGVGKEYSVKIKPETYATIGKFKYETHDSQAMQIASGFRIKTETGTRALSDYYTLAKSGGAEFFQRGKIKIGTETIIEDELSTDVALALTKGSKFVRAKGDYEKLIEATQAQKPFSIEAGIIKETAKIDSVTFGKAKFLEYRGEDFFKKFWEIEKAKPLELPKFGGATTELKYGTDTGAGTIAQLRAGAQQFAKAKYIADTRPMIAPSLISTGVTQQKVRQQAKQTQRQLARFNATQKVQQAAIQKQNTLIKQLQRPVQDITSRAKVSSAQFLDIFSISKPSQKVSQRVVLQQQQQQDLMLDMVVPGGFGTTTPKVIPPPLPKLPIIPFPLPKLYRKPKKPKGLKGAKFKYMPSLVAIDVMAFGRKPKFLTGFEVRRIAF